MIAVAHVGKGAVLGIVDPWFYNEYADGRKMGQYDGFEAAIDVAAWAVQQSQLGCIMRNNQPCGNTAAPQLRTQLLQPRRIRSRLTQQHLNLPRHRVPSS